jgi:hypothetical protein
MTDIQTLVASATSLLDAAVICRVDAGFTLVECAPELYRNYPGTPAPDLAAVLAAVWPDQATSATLMTALTECLNADGSRAYDDSTAKQAAMSGSGFAHDLYMRDSLSDDGEIPYQAGVYQSPDIVPNPADPSALGTQWNSDLGTNVVTSPGLNRIYVRAWNAYPGPQNGSVFLYWSLPSMLMTPSRWSPNMIANQNGTNHANLVAAATGVAVVGDAPFLWSPENPPEDHFCLISQVVTQFQPDTIPADDALENFVEWVRDHPGVAWRNTTTVGVKPGTGLDLTVSFGNPESIALDYLLAVDCTGLPLGTTVTVSCPVSGPQPPINSTTTISQEPEQTILVPSQLPPSFNAVLVITVLPPAGTELPEKMTVIPRNMLQDPPQPALAAKAVAPAALGLDAAATDGTLLYLGDYVFVLVPG